MQSRNFFTFGAQFDVLTSSVFVKQDNIPSNANDNDYLLETDGTNLLLSTGEFLRLA